MNTSKRVALLKHMFVKNNHDNMWRALENACRRIVVLEGECDDLTKMRKQCKALREERDALRVIDHG